MTVKLKAMRERPRIHRTKNTWEQVIKEDL